MTMIILFQIPSQWTMNKILFCVSTAPIGRFEKAQFAGRDFLYSGKLWTRVVQFYSLLCNSDEKPLRKTIFVIWCRSTIYTNFISKGHGTQSQKKQREREFFEAFLTVRQGRIEFQSFAKSFVVSTFTAQKKPVE